MLSASYYNCPKWVGSYNNITVILMQLKRYEETIKYINDSIKIKPNCAIYYTKKGDALNWLGRRKESMNAIFKLLQLTKIMQTPTMALDEYLIMKKDMRKQSNITMMPN